MGKPDDNTRHSYPQFQGLTSLAGAQYRADRTREVERNHTLAIENSQQRMRRNTQAGFVSVVSFQSRLALSITCREFGELPQAARQLPQGPHPRRPLEHTESNRRQLPSWHGARRKLHSRSRRSPRRLRDARTRSALYVANERKLVAVVAPSAAALLALQSHPLGRHSAMIGRVIADHPCMVVMRTPLGTTRIVDMLAGDQLPRIC